MKKNILVTGSSGFIGTSLQSQLPAEYIFEPVDNSDPVNPIDITSYEQVLTFFKNSTADTVVHLAAFTNVTAAWEQTDDTSGVAYQVNVIGTENIVKACEETGKYLIHTSTSFVFDGEKEEQYTEADTPNPIEWYGKTKLLAEEIVQKSTTKSVILRIDQPFSFTAFARKDLVHTIIEQLKENKLYPQFTNHFFGPTIVHDFVKVIDWCIRTQPTGLYHASSGEMWSNYDFAVAIKETLDLPGEVKKGDLDEYLKSLNRPYQRNSALNCQKLHSEIDFAIMRVEEGLGRVEV